MQLRDGMRRTMDPRIQEIDDHLLLIHLYLTQGIILVLGGIGYFFFLSKDGIEGSYFFFIDPWEITLGIALCLAIVIIIVELLLVYSLPKRFFDDGGINQKLFANRPVWHIFLIVAIVALSEEILFRMVIQTKLGLFYASVIFSLIHIRYLRKWVMFSIVFLVSLSLGWLYDWTGSIVSPIICHFLIDFVLALFIRYGWISSKWKD